MSTSNCEIQDDPQYKKHDIAIAYENTINVKQNSDLLTKRNTSCTKFTLRHVLLLFYCKFSSFSFCLFVHLEFSFMPFTTPSVVSYFFLKWPTYLGKLNIIEDIAFNLDLELVCLTIINLFHFMRIPKTLPLLLAASFKAARTSGFRSSESNLPSRPGKSDLTYHIKTKTH